MAYNVYAYRKENGECPVDDFINSLPSKHRAKALWEVDLLKELGTTLKEPYVTPIKGKDNKGLWELRIKYASNISRVLYFMPAGDSFVLLHGFLKKTEKTPIGEIEMAKKYRDDFLRRGK